MYQSFFDTSPITRRIVTSIYYQLISHYLDRAKFSFMNYGYAELGSSTKMIALEDSDEPHRLPIQLYHLIASSVKLGGMDVLEVSCGRGGGASFIKRYHQPRIMVGIDRTQQAIAYCRRMHRLPGLSFIQCNAEDIIFGDESFDMVLNVEASHLYGHVAAFLAEAKRVLRRGGHLLLADKRTQAQLPHFRQQVASSGFRLVSERDISANVLQSIRFQAAVRERIIRDMLPAHLNSLATRIIGADGSHLANDLETRSTIYLSLDLIKD